MTSENPIEASSVLLSRDELLAVLDPLGAEFIPGLDPDPLGDLTQEGWELALTVARRALLARELARQGTDGRWLLHERLLKTVGACAHSQSAVLTYHWSRGSETPVAFYGHLREGEAVAHTRPADVLHRFTVLGPKLALVRATLDFCACAEQAGDAEALAFSVSADALAAARALAGADVAAAAAALEQAGVAPVAAQRLAAGLAAQPQVSAFQTLKQQDGGAVESHEATLIDDGGSMWWIEPGGDALRVQTVGVQQVCDQLDAWL